MRKRGFTLVELLVVIFIIVLVSAVTLPAVLPALSHREVSEGARIFQAALAGIRDAAIRHKEPRGIRLLPDPALTIPSPSDPLVGGVGVAGTSMLAYNRYVPIELAPDYAEGKVTVGPLLPSGGSQAPVFPPPYAQGYAGYSDANFGSNSTNGVYPYLPSNYNPSPPNPFPQTPILMIEQSVFVGGYVVGSSEIPNAPTNWYWNVRVGDRVQIGGDAGHSYTVVGPMVVGPAGGNPDLYVNVGPPGTTPPLTRTHYDSLATMNPMPSSNPEFLFLVNGQDDDGDGYIDEGWDGVNQAPCLNGLTDEASPIPPTVNGPCLDNGGAPTSTPAFQFGEWEPEKWLGPLAQASLFDAGAGTNSPSTSWLAQSGSHSLQDLTYTLSRRPVVSPGAREIPLPSTVVIDATSWQDAIPERSRLPIDPNTLTVDILIDPSGAVVPTTIYSSPASFSMGRTFYHFWLAERQDVHALSELWGGTGVSPNPNPNATANPPQVYMLPMPQGTVSSSGQTYNQTIVLKGDRRLITLNTKSGMVSTHLIENFDMNNVQMPYIEAQVGVAEGR